MIVKVPCEGAITGIVLIVKVFPSMSVSFDNKLEPFKVPSSATVAKSFTATGASLALVTVMARSCTSVRLPVPLSVTVTCTSYTLFAPASVGLS